MDTPDDIANMASQAALAVACTILTSMQMLTRGQPTRNAKASDPEPFNRSQERAWNSLSDPFILLSLCSSMPLQMRG